MIGKWIEAIRYPGGVPVKAGSKQPASFYAFCRSLWRGIFTCTMRVECVGLETLNAKDGFVIAVSHVSHLDPVVMSVVTSRKISWVSRIEFYRYWPMRTVLYLGGALRVDRQGSAIPTIREGLRRLARGEAVGIFPEGELMRGEQSVLRGARIKQGVCTLAAWSGKPVVPVIVLGTHRLVNIGPWLPAKRGRLWVYVGAPIFAGPGARTHAGRAEFAAALEAEYVRLYAKAREAFKLDESIVP